MENEVYGFGNLCVFFLLVCGHRGLYYTVSGKKAAPPP